MDPKTQSEQMEDVRPNDRGFLSDDPPADDIDELEEHGDEAADAPDEG